MSNTEVFYGEIPSQKGVWGES